MLLADFISLFSHSPLSRGWKWWRHAVAFAALWLCTSSTLRAGDLLRNGASAKAPHPDANADSGAAAAALARSNAQDALARTAQALQSVQAMQAAARAAAAGKNNLGANPNVPGQALPAVPNGLVPGGLQISGTPVGANSPTQSGGPNAARVTVKQTSQQAILTWSSFNVGKNTTLFFDQSAGGANASQWIAFNKVNDPTGVPSQILGSIRAQGQVYIINQNGIIFGGTSQVNAHTLVASSLPINENLISRGLLNNPDSQFLFSALALPAGNKGPTSAFTPSSGPIGDVTVQPGAVLTAPTTDAHVGGRVALIGANVTNGGTISTPDGQTILAAGLQVGLVAHSTNDPSLRGLDVYIGAVANPNAASPNQPISGYAGAATNSGLIDAPRANVTMAGRYVNQLGVINSSTSVSLNGRIDLLANYGAQVNPSFNPTSSGDTSPFIYFFTGNVTLGPGSVTQILPEWNSTDRVVGTELALRSQINIQAYTVYLAPQATILAPNANVNINAGVWDVAGQGTANPIGTFVNSVGQVYLDHDAMINVAGSTDVAAPLSEFILNVTLRGTELADSPLERTSIFRPGDGSNPSITVDLRKTGTYNGVSWVGTPLANLSGYVGLIERDVGELTVAGGTVNLHAGGSVVVQPGAVVDVSGGFVNYGGGTVTTTRVLYAGHIMDIADATPNRLYQGIYTGLFTSSHPTWGISSTFTAPWMLGTHYEQPYTAGADGGSIDLLAPSMALDGEFFGYTVSGPRQRDNPPTPSSLSITFQTQLGTVPYTNFSPTPPAVIFSSGSQPAADPFALDASGNALPLRADRVANVFLSPSLFNDRGFGIFTLENSDGNITIPSQTSINAPVNGSITMNGANIDVQGSIIAPGGKVNLNVFNFSPTLASQIKGLATSANTLPNTDRGDFTLGSGASLSTAGLIVDDRLSAPAPLSLPLVTNGGSVSITTYNADLAKGSVIDVSGGVSVSATGKMSYGNAGSIVIKAGQDINLQSILGGHLNLGGTLKGFSGAKGGSLTLQASVIQIGGYSSVPNVLLLKPDFFNEGGFGSFTLIGLGEATGNGDEMIPGVSVAPGTVVEPHALSYLAVPNTPGNGGVVLVPVLKPEGLRTPVSIALSAPGVIDSFTGILTVRGDLVIGAHSLIQTDALGSVSLSGNTVAVFGSIVAPGGSISVTGSSNSISTFPDRTEALNEALTTVYLAPGSLLSTAGKVLLLPDRWGNRTGFVLPGGTISISGNILAEAGATLDVSGTSGILDLPPAYLGLPVPANAPLLGSQLVPVTSGVNSPLFAAYAVPVRVDSSAGTITLKGGQELFTAATLKGNAGGPTALGGSLSISSGKFYTSGTTKLPTDVDLVVTQSDPGFTFGLGGIGLPVTGTTGALTGQGQFAADQFARGGFDALQLNGTVDFSGPVNISARNSIVVGMPSSSGAVDGGVISADSNVHLSAPYVALGKPFTPPVQPVELQNFTPYVDSINTPYHFPPTYGTGKLTVTADLIDIGYLSLQGIGAANFIADNGDIRGQGTLDVAGRIYLRAGQIYPVTASPFTIVAYDYNVGGNTHPGTVAFASSGVRQLPLTAGGTLNVYGSVINQGGTLRAPIGTINLGWDGTGTAPTDLITGAGIPATQQLTLKPGSVTSVSAIDPLTGQGVVIPYGVNPTGNAWIDPTGLDITAGGAPAKSVNISAQSVTTRAGSLIDIRGGGDLYSYQFIPGTGGSKDILASSGSFAVIPGYQANFMPYAPFSTSTLGSANLNGDPGYVNGNLSVGDRVYLDATKGLPAGVYTLLPARYALQAGAFLVTPQSGSPIGTFAMPDGSTLVDGYRFNDLNSSRTVPSIYSRFEVASSTVVRQRSQYQDFFANTFLAQSAAQLDEKTPRLPADGGYLLLSASQAMVVQGSVNAWGATGGRGGDVDISSPLDIVITGGRTAAQPGTLSLDSSLLNSYGADSLLIGGSRTFSTNGTTISVRTDNLTVNNQGTPLSAPEIILVANQNLTLSPGASVQQSGTLSDSADLLLIGDASNPGSGNGTLLRVTSDPNAQIIRSGVTLTSGPSMVVGTLGVPDQRSVHISGTGVTLDSTYATWLDPSAVITGQSVYLNSGQISLQLDAGAAVTQNAIGGLVLAGPALQNLRSVQNLSLLSYSALDIYGAGSFSTLGSLAFHAAEIRGFNSGGTAVFTAPDILLDNSPGRPSPGPVQASNGSLEFDASIVTVGTGQINIDQFTNVLINAPGGVLMQGTGGLATQGALTVNTPLLVGAAGATQSLSAGGALILSKPAGAVPSVVGGLGASVSLSGTTLTAGSDVSLPSGVLSMAATGGNLTVSGRLDVSGTAQTFFDQTRFTDAGQITLSSSTGDVNVSSGSLLNVAAQVGGGNAGSIVISAPFGAFNLAGTMAGAGGTNGTFSLDVGALPIYSTLNNTLNAASFTFSRSLRVRNGDVTVTGTTNSLTFNLSTDQGSINVAGTIDASGVTGGSVDLVAWKNLVLQNGSLVTVAAQTFNNAGKGGTIWLEAGSAVLTGGTYAGATGAVLDIQSGSKIDLSVASNTPGSAGLGDFTGTLHLRAPQNAAGTNLAVNPITGTITGASSITIEGYKIFTPAGGNISTAIQTSIRTSLNTFGNNGLALGSSLLAGNADAAALIPITVVMPGAEVVNLTGDITLGTSSTTNTSDWNLGAVRFGTNGAPGVLTLRAAGNLVFFNALSDGFTTSANNSQLLTLNTALPANVQSWSYRMAAGADFTAADFHRVQSLAALNAAFPGQAKGSLLLGKNGGLNIATSPGAGATTTSVVNGGRGLFQVIRTGTGDIDISAGRDVQFLNQFATIYTVGARVSDPTLGGTFDTPRPTNVNQSLGNLGAVQEAPGYVAQFTMGGGNVSITAGQDIFHATLDLSGNLIADSERELPMNWLDRRGSVDPVTGLFAKSIFGDVASTSWWVDFSNYFEGVGALGGGNVSIIAGRDVINVDGLVPTNARMTGKSGGVAIAPDAANLLELGGGDLVVRAGRNISGGVYYVERGTGTLNAGGSIITNATRTPSLGILKNPAAILAPETWLPTTLFLGTGGFNVSARGDVLLGPTVNPFLLPQGFNNSYWYKTWFSTYASSDYVDVSALGGNVIFRESVTLPSAGGTGLSTPVLLAFMQNENLWNTQSAVVTASTFQPWLRLTEDDINGFSTVATLMPSTLRATAFSGDINLVGNINLSPSPTGTVDLIAAGAFNALQIDGKSTINGVPVNVWVSGSINLSDADPAAVPGVASPFAYQSLVGNVAQLANSSSKSILSIDFLSQKIDDLFAETGSTTGAAAVIQTKQALHDSSLLHATDTQPLRIYAASGDVSGLTLFSGKSARILAGNDITDISLYVQNVSSNDITVVSSGRDIVAFDANSPLRVAGQSPGNAIGDLFVPLADGTQTNARLGDIQISGPGTLEVLAGRNLDLGSAPSAADGTLGVGISSIGNGRNPSLPFGGASVITGAGLGTPGGLDSAAFDFPSFISQFVTGPDGARYLADLSTSGASTITDISAFSALPTSQQDALALEIFYLALRDAGRDHNLPGATGFGNYDAGFAAISALFPNPGTGNINTRSRDIRTKSGGDINILAPGGGLTLQTTTTSTNLTPPGIITEDGGNVNIFTNAKVDLGISRIFTLRGGNIVIWSSTGDIAAGASSKTVQSAPPTRVLIDPQSADVKTDLAGLATGGGIGVLATVLGVPPGNVDLIAPNGVVDAGDAGIRATGNLNIAATAVLNASNIAIGGTAAGVPSAPVVVAPNIAGLTAGSTAAGAGTSAAAEAMKQTATSNQPPPEEVPSIITVEVLGYGGDDQ